MTSWAAVTKPSPAQRVALARAVMAASRAGWIPSPYEPPPLATVRPVGLAADAGAQAERLADLGTTLAGKLARPRQRYYLFKICHSMADLCRERERCDCDGRGWGTTVEHRPRGLAVTVLPHHLPGCAALADPVDA